MGARLTKVLRGLRGILTDRLSLSGEGLSFEGKRNVSAAFGYKKTLTVRDFRARAKRNGVASRITKAYPTATWRGQDVELIENIDPQVTTPFEQAWTDLNRVFKVWAKFRRADRLAHFGRYAVIYIGTDARGSELVNPLTSLSPDQLRYLACFDEEDAKIQEWDKDPKSETYGRPKTYKLKRLTDAAEAGGDTSAIVHASRIIHIPASEQLDDDLFGEPILEACWNYLDDLEKVSGAGAEAFWLRVHQGYVLNVDPELELEAQGEEDLQDEAEAFVNGFQRFIRTRGVEVKALGSDVANYGPNVASSIGLISATTAIPQRILLGSERGELASTQDDANWASRINDRRHEYAEPFIVRPFVERMTALGVLPAVGNAERILAEDDDSGDAPVVQSDYTVAWPKLQDVPIEKRLDIAKKAADLNKAAGDVVITNSEIRNDFLEMEPLTEEQLKEIDDKKAEEAAKKQAELDAMVKAGGSDPEKKPAPKPGEKVA